MNALPAGSTVTHERRERGWLDLWVVAAVAFAVHLPSLGNGFVVDDHNLIEASETIRRPFDLAATWGGRFFTESGVLAPYYRPVVVQSLALNYWAGGLSPFGYHLANLLLHAAVVVLLLLVARQLLPGIWPARLAALLFAVHPLASEPVDAVYGRTDLLATAFTLAAILLHLRAATPRDNVRRALAPAVLYLLALLSKESAAPLPLALLALDAALAARAPAGWRGTLHAWRKRAAGYLLLAGALATYLALRAAALGGLLAGEPVTFLHNPLVGVSAATRFLTAPLLLMKYLQLWLVPWNLSPDYSFNAFPVATGVTDPRLLPGLLACLGFLGLGLWLGRRRHPAFGGWAFFLAFYLLIANLLVLVGALLAERFFYLPMAGLCLAAGAVACGARGGWAARLGTSAVLLILAALSLQRTVAWRDDETVARATIAATPGSALGYNNLGVVLLHGDLPAPERAEKALQAFQQSLAIYPGYGGALLNAGMALVDQGRAAEAVPLLERAHAIVPDGFGVGYALGSAYLRVGRADEAVSPLGQAVRVWPEEAAFQVAFAAALEATGHDLEARDVLLPLVAAGKASSDVLFSLALIEIRLGEFEAAIPHLRGVLAQNPADAAAEDLLGQALAGAGREAEAPGHSLHHSESLPGVTPPAP